ncbi:hypothetical protein HYC85_015948 [Camellia sinensis]|uniref:Uncharacterized protein n=1 Tax=Camellia sinensis TaxID=4442 RepID=A0A7J7GYF3_CAMSI|nr:hypothetical protein HYC85_015948 [Camellia sinensis]
MKRSEKQSLETKITQHPYPKKPLKGNAKSGYSKKAAVQMVMLQALRLNWPKIPPRIL